MTLSGRAGGKEVRHQPPLQPRHSLHGAPDSSSRMGPSLPGTDPTSYQRNGRRVTSHLPQKEMLTCSQPQQHAFQSPASVSSSANPPSLPLPQLTSPFCRPLTQAPSLPRRQTQCTHDRSCLELKTTPALLARAAKSYPPTNM